MRLRFRSVAVVFLIIAAPLLVRSVYLWITSPPREITITTGPELGQWLELSNNLAKAVTSRTKVNVKYFEDVTQGSVQHLDLLRSGRVDFALCLRGSSHAPGGQDSPKPAEPPPMFVGNLYPDVTLFLVRRDRYESGDLRTPADLDDRAENDQPFRVAVGQSQSGEYSIAQKILNHYFVAAPGQRPFDELRWSYPEVKAGFEKGELDAALLTAGHQAPIFHLLLQDDGLCKIGEIPEVKAIVMQNVGLTSATIPQGLFRFGKENIPPAPLQTLSSQTMLLTPKKAKTKMVEEVTKILLSENFIPENRLYELSREGNAYASENPEFPIHAGALHIYEPELKPLVNPDVMEVIESLRSFSVSLLIGIVLSYQWLRRNAEKRKDHRLDEYFAELLVIDREARQAVETDEEAAKLAETLERVIALRNEALCEFSAKDFDEDSAADSFVSLCE